MRLVKLAIGEMDVVRGDQGQPVTIRQLDKARLPERFVRFLVTHHSI